MIEHNKNFYSLEELKRTRDSLEGFSDNEEVYYFVGAIRYACDEIERLNNIINELEKWCLSWKENDKYCYLASNDKDKCRYDIWEEVLDKLKELKGDSSNE